MLLLLFWKEMEKFGTIITLFIVIVGIMIDSHDTTAEIVHLRHANLTCVLLSITSCPDIILICVVSREEIMKTLVLKLAHLNHLVNTLSYNAALLIFRWLKFIIIIFRHSGCFLMVLLLYQSWTSVLLLKHHIRVVKMLGWSKWRFYHFHSFISLLAYDSFSSLQIYQGDLAVCVLTDTSIVCLTLALLFQTQNVVWGVT